MNSKTIVLNKEKETKNTIRYREETEGQPPIVQTIYIQKWFAGSPAPEKIKVTIEPLS
nr:hypothetical protein [Candidatus Baldrarchaeota archaeon]